MELEREKVRTLHLQTYNSTFLCKAFTHTHTRKHMDTQTHTKGVSRPVQGRSRTFQHLSQTVPWGCGRPVVWGGCPLSFPLQAMHNKQVCGAELTWCRGLLDMEHAAVRQSHQPADVKCTRICFLKKKIKKIFFITQFFKTDPFLIRRQIGLLCMCDCECMHTPLSLSCALWMHLVNIT